MKRTGWCGIGRARSILAKLLHGPALSAFALLHSTMYDVSAGLPIPTEHTPWTTSSAGVARCKTAVALPSCEFDCVIVGAGFTGLACARRLATFRPDWKIAVLDAFSVGEGATDRHSGFVMSVGHWQPHWDDDTNRAVSELSVHGSLILRYIVHERGIDCGWHDGQRFHVAAKRKGQKALAQFAEGMARIGRPLRTVNPDAFSEQVGTTFYRAAVESTAGALVDPSRLVRGVAASLPDSVTIYEGAGVLSVQSHTRPAKYELQTPRGRVRARRFVATTNAVLDSLAPTSPQVARVSSFASITRALSDAPGELKQWGLVPAERSSTTLRLTADRRIVLRSSFKSSGNRREGSGAVQRATRIHRASLAERFPELAELPFSSTWGGCIESSGSAATVFGSLGENAWMAGIHNGVGMAMGTALGDMLAHRIADSRHPLLHSTSYLPELPSIPREALLSAGVAVYERWQSWRSDAAA